MSVLKLPRKAKNAPLLLDQKSSKEIVTTFFEREEIKIKKYLETSFHITV